MAGIRSAADGIVTSVPSLMLLALAILPESFDDRTPDRRPLTPVQPPVTVTIEPTEDTAQPLVSTLPGRPALAPRFATDRAGAGRSCQP